MYNIYVYLNPFKPGKFSYPNLPVSFLYEPFYVGEGGKDRYKEHIWKSDKSNPTKKDLMYKIIDSGINLFSYVIFLDSSQNKEEIQNIENLYITSIGRQLDGGSLTNIRLTSTKGIAGWVKVFEKPYVIYSSGNSIEHVYNISKSSKNIGVDDTSLRDLVNGKRHVIFSRDGLVYSMDKNSEEFQKYCKNIKLFDLDVYKTITFKYTEMRRIAELYNVDQKDLINLVNKRYNKVKNLCQLELTKKYTMTYKLFNTEENKIYVFTEYERYQFAEKHNLRPGCVLKLVDGRKKKLNNIWVCQESPLLAIC